MEEGTSLDTFISEDLEFKEEAFSFPFFKRDNVEEESNQTFNGALRKFEKMNFERVKLLVENVVPLLPLRERSF